MTVRYVVADWLDHTERLHAFEGVVTGHWNGFAEWMTTRPVIEKIAALHASHPDADQMPSFHFEGDTLVLRDDGIEWSATPPQREGAELFWPIGFGMVWSDRLDPDQTYTIHRMDGSESIGRLVTTFVEADTIRFLSAIAARDEWGRGDAARARAEQWLWENQID